jgi:hypothetical protein
MNYLAAELRDSSLYVNLILKKSNFFSIKNYIFVYRTVGI